MPSMPKSRLAVRAKSRLSIFFPKSALWKDHSASEILNSGFLLVAADAPNPRAVIPRTDVLTNVRRFIVGSLNVRRLEHSPAASPPGSVADGRTPPGQ